MKDAGLIRWIVAFCSALMMAAGHAQTFSTIRSFGSNIAGFHPQSTLVQGPDEMLYGTTYDGEGSVAGTVFKVLPDGSGFTLLKLFTNSFEGANPSAGVTLSGSVLYGTTYQGGSSNYGTVFKINTDGTGFQVLKNFAGGGDGANPSADLTLAGSVLYGTTYQGGIFRHGALFKINTDGSGHTVLKHFANVDGANPSAGLTMSGSLLFGTTSYGGIGPNPGSGTVFVINTDGTGFNVLRNFAGSDGANPTADLALLGGVLYGTTSSGGSSNQGTVFAVNTDGTGYNVLKNFTNSDGAIPYAGLHLASNVLYGTTSSGGSSNQGTVFALNLDGTGYRVVKSFVGSSYNPSSDSSTNSEGASPYAGPILSGGVLYGTARLGGSSGHGTLFKLNTDGTGYTVLKDFATSPDGGYPTAGLISAGGILYGTTEGSGALNSGTVFAMNMDGTGYTTLHTFTNTPDGAHPFAGLTLYQGVLYGTTRSGGGLGNFGTVFKVNSNGTGYAVSKNFGNGDGGIFPKGALSLLGGELYGTTSFSAGTIFLLGTVSSGFDELHVFTNSPDGSSPYAGLTVSGSVLYGTTSRGGSSANGTIFKINWDATAYSVLKSFAYPDGMTPYAGLTLSGSVLYGATFQGGSADFGTVFKLNTDGSGFTVLKSFAGGDGANPRATLTLYGSALYGTTSAGGGFGLGTVFRINTNGTGYAVLRNFSGSDGASPYSNLLMSGSALYGTTSAGGSYGLGTVFKLDLSPLLTIQPAPNAVVLSWPDPSFTLQSATAVTGTFTNIPGATSPYTNTVTGSQLFFRLIGN